MEYRVETGGGGEEKKTPQPPRRPPYTVGGPKGVASLNIKLMSWRCSHVTRRTGQRRRAAVEDKWIMPECQWRTPPAPPAPGPSTSRYVSMAYWHLQSDGASGQQAATDKGRRASRDSGDRDSRGRPSARITRVQTDRGGGSMCGNPQPTARASCGKPSGDREGAPPPSGCAQSA